jgi:hypothetical protein
MSYRKTKAGQTSASCRACKQVKELAEFSTPNISERGLHWGSCRACRQDKSKAETAGRTDAVRMKRAQWVKQWRDRLPLGVRREKERDSNLRRYGLNAGRYDAMCAAQNGQCAICGQSSDKNLHVDHCHTTGAVRGLLCGKCNTAIGQFDEDPQRMYAAIAYLQAVKQKVV